MKKTLLLTALLGSTVIVAMAMTGADARDGDFSPKNRFERADTNGDGLISPSEASAQAAARIADADANGDGGASEKELRAFARKTRDEFRQHMKGDQNDDGVVSRDEFMTQAEKRFTLVDANGDNVLDEEERKRARRMMRHMKRMK